METSTEIRKIRGFKCDECGKEMIPGKELVIKDKTWEILVGKSKSPYPPKTTLLCPSCIEKLYGGIIKAEDLVQEKTKKNGNTYIIALPMNYWYYKKHGYNMFRGILGHYRYFKGPDERRVWENSREKSESLINE